MILNKTNVITYDKQFIKNIITNIPGLAKDAKKLFNLQSHELNRFIQPEILSQILYNTTAYDWTFFLINNMIDPWWDWPETDEMIIEKAKHIYKSLDDDTTRILGIDQIHHHYDPKNESSLYWDLVEYPNQSKYFYHIGDIYHERPQFIGDLVPVTNLEYEIDLNDKKKNIKVVPKSQINGFSQYIQSAINTYYG